MIQMSLAKHIKLLTELDHRFDTIVSKIGKIELPEPRQPYSALVKAIIYQQLSGKAATTIYNRFLDLFPNDHPETTELINTPHEKLRSVGLSNRKAEYVKDIARFFDSKPMTLTDFDPLTDEEIGEKLITIRGIGPWSIDMFLMFTLHRLDVFPIVDLGVKKGFAKLYRSNTLLDDEYMIKEAHKWSPYRTIASMYLWKILDNEIEIK